MSDMEPETPDNKAPESTPEASAATPAKKPVRRAVGTGSGVRRASGDAKPPAPSGPPKPDMAKTIMLGLCAFMAVACIGVLVYILAIKKKPEKTAGDKLDASSKALVDKADRAKKLYEDGKAKSGSDKLDELVDSEKNLFEALNLFNEIADEYKTVKGFEDTIKLAHDKKPVIDAELKKVRDRKTELEFQADRERREKAKATKTDKPAEPAPPTPTPAGKEPSEEELSDKNLDRLFNDDPSEYERLAKIREKKDPTFKMKKP